MGSGVAPPGHDGAGGEPEFKPMPAEDFKVPPRPPPSTPARLSGGESEGERALITDTDIQL